MGKKKGRQAGSFPSKAMRASFCAEWQAQVESVAADGDEYPCKAAAAGAGAGAGAAGRVSRKDSRRAGPPQVVDGRWVASATDTHGPSVRPSNKRGVRLLPHGLNEGFHDANLHETAQATTRTSRRRSSATDRDSELQPHPHPQPAPQPLNIYDDNHDDDDDRYREHGLALLCIRALAPVLHDYIRVLGRQRVHYYLSLVPAKTLTALSVELSTRNLWTATRSTIMKSSQGTVVDDDDDDDNNSSMMMDLVYVVAQHACLERLALWWSRHDDDDDDNAATTSNAITDDLLAQALLLPRERNMQLQLVQRSSSWTWSSSGPALQQHAHRVVPESWEDEVDSDYEHGEEGHRDHCARRRRRFQRLDLRNLPQLSLATLQVMVSPRYTTHLTLCNTCRVSLNENDGQQWQQHDDNNNNNTNALLAKGQQWRDDKQVQCSSLQGYLRSTTFSLLHLDVREGGQGQHQRQ